MLSFLLSPIRAEEDGAMFLSEHRLSGGIMGHTIGLGLDVTYERQNRANRHHILSLAFRSQNHSREAGIIDQILSREDIYTFGQDHSFYTSNLKYGQSYTLTRGYERQDVIIDLRWQGGVSVGLLKPVYFEIEQDGDETVFVDKRFDPEEHTEEDIRGKSDFSKGLGEVSPVAGTTIRGGIGFRWKKNEGSYRHFEAGIGMDGFPSEIPIFAANAENKRLFFNLFLKYSFGKSW